MKHVILFVFILLSVQAYEQVSINNSNTPPNASAMLDVGSTSTGMLIPRMTTAQRNAIASPAEGLSVYDTDTKSYWYYSGTAWGELSAVNANLWTISGSNIYNANAGNVGIGTATPNANALLHVNLGTSTTNGMLVTGSIDGSATVPDLGAGCRMMFYPGKCAFRAGMVEGTQWDDANVGFSSVAMGRNTTASGFYSTAVGYGTSASGTYSTAMGRGSIASGFYSTAMGYATTASGYYSTAMGHATTGSGDYSTVMGESTTGLGNHSTAMGYGTFANADYSTAMGTGTVASGISATAMGASSTASGAYSTAMGNSTFAKASGGTVVGLYNNNSDNPNPFSPAPSDRLFQIGNGDAANNIRSNALTVLRDGSVGIGTTTPMQTLDVAGRMNVSNGVIQKGGTAITSTSDLGLYSQGSGEWMRLVTNNAPIQFYTDGGAGTTQQMSILSNGNVGIGTTSPSQKLAVTTASSNASIASFTSSGGFGQLLISNSTTNVDIGATTSFGYAGTNNAFDFVLRTGAVSRIFLQHSSGNVGIGTNSPSQRLTVAGNICATGTIGACSDIRYKTNLLPLSNVLASVLSLNPIYYNWKRDFKGYTDQRQIGFSAQEVEKLYPEMVQTDAEGYKAVDYSRMTPVLVEAIKEQQQEISQLKAKLERMETQMAALLKGK